MIRLDDNEISFPDPELYDGHDGLIAYGGDLSVERIWFAYQLGIFPWFNPGEEILWWSPDPRFVLFPKEIKVSKSMQKILNRNVFSFSENRNFREVITHCQQASRKGQTGTWLSDELMESFIRLHEYGLARSIEVWQGNELVGGFYGLQIGNVFCGESMFAKVSNASKAGFIHFVETYKDTIDLIDCQSHTDHLESLGARMIPKKEFLKILHDNNERR
ncbi:leucyl/phenylalanyl-tRNA--protein transferase [Chryseobacterium indologenes]|uniref:Leucyl/phenylalanyl-tRNA--protein transferase n=1 Tax=Chryseobacterium indologenes TaxID=253 RepID=A0AAD0YX65_CHRID|nr:MULTISPECIES: leucyl/phenylalanyl-tRNA--protein transferase [Chryseobacterium]ASE63225.1 leucyl/phenylalanyl-tRNA--protein transferase [Chryseobacterium indologenes]AYZ37864.1 leucyl/phenylalanyl-tRNA--protein transferase [Chryseobacterium indologenes]AZB18935.1 leucyl/phenylalanyl-tRNA--protein transferase [Chryseobacterium indologenes]MBF6646777.1 leucyl/phenylalanyl-tRNA--protein transferase [Chryseobacterium indologenes]MBU3047457.1 leucyl/phenylalanyl-tRNA--protein transferase [Chryseo